MVVLQVLRAVQVPILRPVGEAVHDKERILFVVGHVAGHSIPRIIEKNNIEINSELKVFQELLMTNIDDYTVGTCSSAPSLQVLLSVGLVLSVTLWSL